MSFHIVHGDIFTPKSDVLVNPVNTQGVMGAGLAKQFKERLPNEYFKCYADDCNDMALSIGNLTFWGGIHEGRYLSVANFPTKHHWKQPSKLLYIQMGLVDLSKWLEDLRPSKVVAIPALGCGLGGLSWDDVSMLIVDELKEAVRVRGHDVLLFEPKEI